MGAEIDLIQQARDYAVEAIKGQEEDLQDTLEAHIDESDTGEIGLTNLKNVFYTREGAVNKVFQGYRERILKGSGHELDRIKDESAKFVRTTQAVIEMIAGQDGQNKLSHEEIRIIMNIVQGVEKFAENNEGVTIVQKLKKDPPEPLIKEDHLVIANYLHLEDLGEGDLAGREQFEKTTAGIIISLMSPGQLEQFITDLMDSPFRSKADAIVSGLMQVGIMDLRQGEGLLTKAYEHHDPPLMSPERYQAYMLDLKHFYPGKRKETQDQIAEAVTRLKGQFAINELARTVGPRGLGTLAQLYAGLGFVTNLLASKGDVVEALGNPYLLAAVGIFMAGRSMSEHGGNVGASWGGIVAMLEGIGGDDSPKTTAEAQAYLELNELYGNKLAFGNYLQSGGAEIILEIQNQHEVAENHKPITYAELTKRAQRDGNQKHQAWLAEAKREAKSEAAVTAHIGTFLKASNDLGIKNQEDFDRKIALLDDAKRSPQTSQSSQSSQSNTMNV